MTVTNCGVPVTYDQAPKRAVSNDINTTEDMLALGLRVPDGRYLRGDRRRTGRPAGPGPVHARLSPGTRHLLRLLHAGELVGLHPDFLFAGWNYGLQTGTNLTPDDLSKYGIKTLALTESCAHVQPGTARQHRRHLPGPRQPRGDLRRPAGAAGDRRHAGPGGSGPGQGGRPEPGHGLRLRQRRVGAVHRTGAGHAHRADQPRRRDQHLRRAQADLDVGVLGAGRRPTRSASSSTTTAPRRPPRRRSSWRPAPSPRTSPRSRTTASCR